MPVKSSLRRDVTGAGQGTSDCLYSGRRNDKSGRSELTNWHLCYGQLAPVQLQFCAVSYHRSTPLNVNESPRNRFLPTLARNRVTPPYLSQ